MDYEDFIGWGIIVVILIYTSIPVGLGLAIASLVKKEPKMIYAKIGLLVNLAFILFLLVTFITALLESGDIRKW